MCVPCIIKKYKYHCKQCNQDQFYNIDHSCKCFRCYKKFKRIYTTMEKARSKNILCPSCKEEKKTIRKKKKKMMMNVDLKIIMNILHINFLKMTQLVSFLVVGRVLLQRITIVLTNSFFLCYMN